jgi:peptidoglycan/xylan/chitin deacetylase (PgdA/CDA1 family)
MILAYHRINPWYENDALTVRPEDFERQIKYLQKKGYKFVSLKEYIAIKTEKGQRQHKICCFTFDDGFADNLWFAAPILEKYKIPAVIFIAVMFIGIKQVLPRYKDTEKDRFLRWEEVKKMADSGILFGSHALTHPRLTQIDDSQAYNEIIKSKEIIKEKIGKEAEYFCYPFGDINQNIISLVKKAGYKAAVLTYKKNIPENLFTLRRTGIYGKNNFFIYRIKIWRTYLREKKSGLSLD